MPTTRLYNRLVRLKNIERMLLQAGSGGLKITEIASRTGVNRRTIYRDMICLSVDFFVPIYDGDDGRYCIRREGYLSPFPGPIR